MRISSFSVWLCKSELPPTFSWRKGLPSSRDGFPAGTTPRHAVIRMETDCCKSAWVTSPTGELAFDLVRRRFHLFLGQNPLMTEDLWHQVWEVDRIEEIHIKVFGLLDLLAWDLKSRLSELPVHQLLGGNATTLQAYASTVTFPTIEDYERHIKLCMDVGFSAFKLHAWGDVRSDIELCRALRRWAGSEAILMLDGSAGWDYVDALEVGLALQDEGFFWYEEPMREFHLGAYKKLCDDLSIPVLAAETSDGVHWNAASWIEAGALDMMRVSTLMKGGLTGAIKVAHLAESFGMRAQVHAGGMANAQLCAAIPNNDFFEQLVINEDQIKGLSTLDHLPICDGFLTVSSEPGLCAAYKADQLDEIAVDKFHVDARDL